MNARIVLDDIHPRTPSGAYPAKAAVGEPVVISADIFKDGHDVLAARVKWRPSGTRVWLMAPMKELLNDRWQATIAIDTVGNHDFQVEAWTDVYGTWRHKLDVKLHAGQDVALELEEGRIFFSQRSKEAALQAAKSRLNSIADMLGNESLDYASRAASAMTDEVAASVAAPGKTDAITSSPLQKLWVDREIARYGSWYQFFPRSVGGLKDAAEFLQYVAGMNFDVVYLPPIHPIGTSFRKGKNNTLTPTIDDVGSPYAIGSADGGHTDIEPDLGTIDDFDALVARAKELGLEIALDNALQCSPDHPWVTEHPEWFHARPDGSIAYAENPPKKYQDIYPINFWPESETDRVAVWEACKYTFDYWIDHGVKIFRVDNPHTKPMAFWAWCISSIQKVHPDVIFLSEAFTRPKVMSKLAEVGFSQSYTYFTWRTYKQELIDYTVEVAISQKAEYMRPNFWPNTHDILLPPLRNGGLGAFKMRLVLAATLVANYGIYSGFELGENEPLDPEKNTDYLHSEKYEIKHRDFDAPHSLAPYVAKLNDVRRRHPALQQLRNIWFHGADNDQIICYSKRDLAGSDTVLVIVNLDPYNPQECTVDLNLEELGVPHNEPFEAYDELMSRPFYWWGARNYVRLEPGEPAHVLHIRRNVE